MIATAILVLLGAAVGLYPSTAMWFSALDQQRRAERYTTSVERLTPADREESLAAAERYNASLPGHPILHDPFSGRRDGTEDEEYRSLLMPEPAGPLAGIDVPAIGVSLPIYHGTDESTLRRGAGHLKGTALPVGGKGSHAVITAHRGLPEAELFTHLDRVVEGDEVSIQVLGRSLVYRVVSVTVIEPTDVDSLQPVAGRDLLSLITCTPLGVNSHRIVVTAERVWPTSEAERVDGGPGFPWWALIGSAVIIGVVLYVRRNRELVPIARESARTGGGSPSEKAARAVD